MMYVHCRKDFYDLCPSVCLRLFVYYNYLSVDKLIRFRMF